MTKSRREQAAGSHIVVKYDFKGPAHFSPAALHMLSFEARSPESPGTMSVGQSSGAHSRPGLDA